MATNRTAADRVDMMRGRGHQTKRQWEILKYLAIHRYSRLTDLAREFQCSLKTIHRDIEALIAVDFPIYRVTNPEGNGKFIRLDRNWLDLHATPAGPQREGAGA